VFKSFTFHAFPVGLYEQPSHSIIFPLFYPSYLSKPFVADEYREHG